MKLPVVITVLTLVSAVCARCPGSVWVEFENHCYLCSTIASPWHAIFGSCDYAHPNLSRPVSLHSAEQSAFLGSQMPGQRVWLGLGRKTPSEDFQWLDGTPLDFQDWKDGQPTQEGNCVLADYTLDGKWEVAPCADPHLFACEMDSFE